MGMRPVQAGRVVSTNLQHAKLQNLPIGAMMPTVKNIPTRVRMLVRAL